ncbi:hypothetical protein [Tersicoccus sp. Bi-70]|uniref:hypothetical protein n=1 Tax=Tersicoccus sp. Bi-70 TaxID=1897634 RepID=UPI000975CF50|nr:hypothetical protein [Tersicoccus sp. Bi-70]OMH31541.1 hypothetical protein BGP79_11285 [Tersicoccus sp. Bi-70]
MTARLYDLASTWTFATGVGQVWDVIADPALDWSAWWPGCTPARPVERSCEQSAERSGAGGTSREDLLLASTATFDFHASLGYTLRISFHATRVERLREVAFDAGEDLTGTGRVALTARADGGTDVVITWAVRPAKRWMVALSPIAAPVFTLAHHAMMRRGEAGLRRHLAELVRDTDRR